MTGNQREMERKNRKSRKDRKNKIIAWVVIAVIILVLAIMKICEININSVKDHFTDSNGNFTLTQGVVDNNFPYNLDSSQGVVMKNVNGKLCALTPTGFSVINSKNAEEEYAFSHGYLNPLLKNSGIYTLLYDQGAKQMRLDDTSGNVYQHSIDSNILCADVSKNGNVAYSATSDEKKCIVSVINKSVKQKFECAVSYGYVVDVSINDAGNKLAFVAVNSENARLKSKLFVYTVGVDEPKAEIDLPEGNIIDIEYSSDSIYVVGESYIGVVNNGKKYKSVFDSKTVNTVSFTYTPSNYLVLVYNEFNNSTENTIVKIKPNGRFGKSASISGNIKSVSASSSVVSVLTTNEIVSFSLGNMKEKSRVETDDSVKSICRMGSDVFIHRQSLIDEINTADK